MPAEVREHLETCRACREEVEALKALERELALASPPLEDGKGLEDRFAAAALASARAASPRLPLLQRWRAAAAVLIFAAGLAAVATGMDTGGTPAASLQASLSAAEKQSVSRGLESLTDPTAEGSTAALLGLAETSVGKEAAGQSPDDLDDYLNPIDTGGWNG